MGAINYFQNGTTTIAKERVTNNDLGIPQGLLQAIIDSHMLSSYERKVLKDERVIASTSKPCGDDEFDYETGKKVARDKVIIKRERILNQKREIIARVLESWQDANDSYGVQGDQRLFNAQSRLRAIGTVNEVNVNSHGVNTALSYAIQDYDTMKSHGFSRNYNDTGWHAARCVIEDKYCQTTLLVDLDDKVSVDGLDICVLDEAYGQPYDYQRLLVSNPKNKAALSVKKKVEDFMQELSDAGIIIGFEPGMYI